MYKIANNVVMVIDGGVVWSRAAGAVAAVVRSRVCPVAWDPDTDVCRR